MFNLSSRREKDQFGMFRVAKTPVGRFCSDDVAATVSFRLGSLAPGRIQQEITLTPVAIHPSTRDDGLSGEVFVDKNITIIACDTAR